MTQREISEFTGYQISLVNKWFGIAEKISPTIAAKKGKSTKVRAVDYTLEETLLAMQFNPTWTPMQTELLSENFIERKEGYLYQKYKVFKPKSYMEHFFFMYRHHRGQLNVCATCAYLMPRAWDVSRVILYLPYCTFYETFFFNKYKKYDVYKDKCKTYRFSNKKPYVFLPAGQPQHLDMNFKQPKAILGIPNDKFKSKRTGPDKEPVLLAEIKYAGH